MITKLGTILLCVASATSASAAAAQDANGGRAIDIETAHGTPHELQTKALLESLLHKYDLTKYTFTDHVVIEEGAMNHSFPVITLNVRFRDSPDAQLSSYVHEQLHWYLREYDAQRLAAINALRRESIPTLQRPIPKAAERQSAPMAI